MKSQPCYSLNIPGLDNKVVANLTRGGTVTFDDTNTKQTSRCGSNQDPLGKSLCWIMAKTASGKPGWVPAARGSFTDAFCGTAPSQPAEDLIVNPCGEHLCLRQHVSLIKRLASLAVVCLLCLKWCVCNSLHMVYMILLF